MKSFGTKSEDHILGGEPEGRQSHVKDSLREVGLSRGTLSYFCFPDYKGCYLCEDCWFKNWYGQDFWSTKDIDPDYVAMGPEERLRFVDEGGSPFLLSF